MTCDTAAHPTAASVEEVLGVVRRRQGGGRALLHRVAGPPDLEVRASGAWVDGLDSRRYLDLGSFAVFLLGHRHPSVVEAVHAQLDVMALSTRSLASQVVATALEAVADLAPPGLDRVMLLSTGAEAVEAAIKLARARTGRSGLVHLEGSFHGKTTGALALTDSEVLRRPFHPLLPGVARISRTDAATAAETIRATSPAAVFVEAIQGEGGIVELATPFLRALRAACDDAGALLVADEIQCGLGRSGEPWAVDAAGVRPDVLLMGKALGGGVVPASALVATDDAFAPYERDPLLHTSTFGGNPLAAAAVTATASVLRGRDVAGRARDLGQRVRTVLDDVATAAPDVVAGVRGRGLMLGLSCRTAEAAGVLLREAAKRGVLLTPCLTSPTVVRVFPPAFLTEEELEHAASALSSAALAAAHELTSTMHGSGT